MENGKQKNKQRKKRKNKIENGKRTRKGNVDEKNKINRKTEEKKRKNTQTDKDRMESTVKPTMKKQLNTEKNHTIWLCYYLLGRSNREDIVVYPLFPISIPLYGTI